MAYAYWVPEVREYKVRDEPLCIPVEPIRAAMEGPPGVRHPVEVWEHHPWATTDPKVPTYQDCPRCGARRVAIPDALANAAAAGRAGLPPRDRDGRFHARPELDDDGGGLSTS